MGPYKKDLHDAQKVSSIKAYKRHDRSVSGSKDRMSLGSAKKLSPERPWGIRRFDKHLSKFDHTTGKYCCAFHRSEAMRTKETKS
tara:strand:+ start:350 stop:604 length:255 start_codon:yes stop_codon:yes gene_type:complete